MNIGDLEIIVDGLQAYCALLVGQFAKKRFCQFDTFEFDAGAFDGRLDHYDHRCLEADYHIFQSLPQLRK